MKMDELNVQFKGLDLLSVYFLLKFELKLRFFNHLIIEYAVDTMLNKVSTDQEI